MRGALQHTVVKIYAGHHTSMTFCPCIISKHNLYKWAPGFEFREMIPSCRLLNLLICNQLIYFNLLASMERGVPLEVRNFEVRDHWMEGGVSDYE